MLNELYVQMYSFSHGAEYDTEKYLRQAAAIGYAGVELFGPNLELPPEHLKQLAEALGLKVISLHADSTAIEGLIPYAAKLGLPFMGIGMQRMETEADCHAFAARLNELGTKTMQQGIKLTYHNHTQEFAPCGETRFIDILMAETDPSLVAFELDAGWCAAAGVDPVELITQYAGRFALIHVKEMAEVIGPQPPMNMGAFPKDENGMPVPPPEFLENMKKTRELDCRAGKGLVDWAKLRLAADAQGCRAYIVEREYTELESMEQALAEDFAVYTAIM